MRKIQIENLPNDIYFWRRNMKYRYLKISGSQIVAIDGPPDYFPEMTPNEEVVSDPNWCSNCWRELNWPPVGQCPFCGEEKMQRGSLDEIKEELAEWTGNKIETQHV